MQIEDKVFLRKRFDPAKLIEYGFRTESDESVYVFQADLMGGDFRAIVTVGPDGRVNGTVIDVMDGEEYAPLRNENYNGAYVGSVRQEYEELLTDIADKCCHDVLFASDQSNRIAALILDKYSIAPDFPWDSEANRSSGVFRHPGSGKTSGKWFGLVMHIRRNQLDSNAPDEPVDVINLKKNEADSARLEAMAGVYPAFHMNHKLWISVLLDDTLPDDAVMELIDDSYRLTDKKQTGISEEIIQRVLLIADCVPPGQVITYGQIAEEAGIPRNARLVGKIMSMADRYGDHPCHRVVAHNGRTVPGWKEQRAMLEAEGITFTENGCVNMQRHNIP